MVRVPDDQEVVKDADRLESGPFAMVPTDVAKRDDLTLGELRLLVLLASYAHRNTREAWPSWATLARRLKRSAWTVRGWMEGLIRKGLVVKRQRRPDPDDPHGQWDTNIFIVAPFPEDDPFSARPAL